MEEAENCWGHLRVIIMRPYHSQASATWLQLNANWGGPIVTKLYTRDRALGKKASHTHTHTHTQTHTHTHVYIKCKCAFICPGVLSHTYPVFWFQIQILRHGKAFWIGKHDACIDGQHTVQPCVCVHTRTYRQGKLVLFLVLLDVSQESCIYMSNIGPTRWPKEESLLRTREGKRKSRDSARHFSRPPFSPSHPTRLSPLTPAHPLPPPRCLSSLSLPLNLPPGGTKSLFMCFHCVDNFCLLFIWRIIKLEWFLLLVNLAPGMSSCRTDCIYTQCTTVHTVHIGQLYIRRNNAGLHWISQLGTPPQRAQCAWGRGSYLRARKKHIADWVFSSRALSSRLWYYYP